VLVIRAVSFNGRPLGQEILARFDEAGGTIGRGDSSTLVLPDPERFISRTHASISYQAGGFIITDNSTKNPTILNGQPIGPGSAKRLAHGDRIQLGGYVLTAELTSPVAPAAAVVTAPASGAPRDDPWAAFKAPAASAPDPFADLLKPRPSTPPSAPPATPPAAPGMRQDPLADLGRPPGSAQDPFADLLKPRASTPPLPATPPIAPARPPDPLADLQDRQPSIDEVLGLRPSGVPDLLRPEGRSIPPPALPGSPGVVDPLEALGGAPKQVPPPTVPDQGPELFTPYTPPAARPDPDQQTRVEPVAIPSPPSAAEPPASPGGSVRPAAEEPALLQALLRGAGISDSPLLRSLTPETMEAIGQLLREAVQGTLDLLRARGLTKHEMRADVTMIMPVDNNPLKFSPTVEAAMAHLLAPHVQGFLPPLRAMKNAYDDLRAHELGVLAGMRAALDEVLARFAPEELKKRLSGPGVLDNLLPANRKAKQWDLFVERYEAVAEEARENFHAAFGKAFRRAYEEQVKQIRAEERRG
jgi:FHA domain-containing protein